MAIRYEREWWLTVSDDLTVVDSSIIVRGEKIGDMHMGHAPHLDGSTIRVHVQDNGRAVLRFQNEMEAAQAFCLLPKIVMTGNVYRELVGSGPGCIIGVPAGNSRTLTIFGGPHVVPRAVDMDLDIVAGGSNMTSYNVASNQGIVKQWQDDRAYAQINIRFPLTAAGQLGQSDDLVACGQRDTIARTDARMSAPAVIAHIQASKLTGVVATCDTQRSVALVVAQNYTYAEPGGMCVFDGALGIQRMIPFPGMKSAELQSMKIGMHPSGRWAVAYSLNTILMIDLDAPKDHMRSGRLKCQMPAACRGVLRDAAMFDATLTNQVGLVACWDDGTTAVWYLDRANRHGIVKQSAHSIDYPVHVLCTSRANPCQVVVGLKPDKNGQSIVTAVTFDGDIEV